MGTLVQNRQILLRSAGKLSHWSVFRADRANLAGATFEFETRRGMADEEEEVCAPALDWQIWSNLQPELVARILSQLPLTARVHTRLVSKRWDREVYAGRVLGDESMDELSPRAWLFLFENGGPGHPHKLHAFDPAQSGWHTFTTIPHFATVQKIGGLSLCGAACGLMVYEISALKSHFIRFGVFNPLTRSWKKLPPLLTRRQRPVVSMLADCPSSGGHYKLVVAGGLEYDQPVQSTEVYDSRTECWRTTCAKFNSQHSHICDEMRTSTTSCDGVVYHMRFNQMLSFDPNREHHTFVAYDTKSARWRPLRVALPADLVFTEYPSLKRVWRGRAHLADVLPPILVEANGRLLLVGFREDRVAATIAGVAIWELAQQKKLWTPVAAMPDALFSHMCPTVCTSAYVDPASYLKYELHGAAHGDLVYVFQANAGQGVVALCDFSHSPPSWRCIRTPQPGDFSHSQSLQGCVIDLRLDTMI